MRQLQLPQSLPQDLYRFTEIYSVLQARVKLQKYTEYQFVCKDLQIRYRFAQNSTIRLVMRILYFI